MIELLLILCVVVGAFLGGGMLVFSMLGRAEKKKVKAAINEIINTRKIDPKIFSDRD